MSEQKEQKTTAVKNAIRQIILARKATGITQTELAGRAYLSTTAVEGMENKGNSSLAVIGTLIDALLESPEAQGMDSTIIDSLRASKQEIRQVVGTDVSPFSDVYPLTPVQIKNIRKILGMSQAQLAKSMLVSNAASVCQWESNKNPRIPRAHHRVRLVKLGIGAVGQKAGLTGKAAEDLLFSTLELMAGPIVQVDETGQEDNTDVINSPQDTTSLRHRSVDTTSLFTKVRS